ncbi:NERD domain-containing protein kinase family protein [Lujinxingia vulgaris]|nr:NERD domain-containing protein kinase family protein [Lujinxingia vulgaris]
MATYIPIGAPANDAETEGIRLLRDLLPDHYVVIGNFDLRLKGRRNSLEFDAVVIGEHGIYAVEIKGWSGPITGDARRWTTPWTTLDNPLTHLERKTKALRQFVAGRTEGFDPAIFCAPVVLFPRQVEGLELPEEQRRHVVQPDEIYGYFVDLELLHKHGPGPLRDAALHRAVVEAIVPEANALKDQVTIEAYEIEEELEVGHRHWREFLGQHRYVKSRGKVRIKAYTMDLLGDAERQQAELARAVRDTEALSVLDDNPYVARSYDMVRDKDDELIFYMISEYVGSKTLGTYLERAREHGWKLARRLKLACELVEAVKSIHQAGIIHRNLHPGVFYMTRGGARVPFKIADFDFARVQQLDSISDDLNSIGTEGYRAPELWMGEPYDHRVDIFSLGAILYELMTLERLFEGMGDLLQIDEIWSKRRQAIIWPQLAEAIGEMIRSSADERVASLEAVARALDGIEPGQG